MAPPLDRKELYPRDWKAASRRYFRLPRRTRRATYMCWALVIGLLYLTVSSATNWRVPGISAFTPRNPVLIRFPKLYHTLSRVVGNRGKKWNRNVVFVAGNILSATKLADVACEMAEFKRCNVHLALMLVEDFDVDDFRRFNALGETDTGECRVVVHDARPEAVRDMSPERRRLAVKSAFRHIGEFMHPKAILIDPTHEDEWFVEIAKEKAEQMNSVLIELPEKILRDLRWITRLDSGGLNAWNTSSFEVVIHADAHVGNLERLLKSLEHASYPSPAHRPKRITIVLDPFTPLHSATSTLLQNYRFPSEFQVAIKRPLIPPNDASAAAINFIDSFYTLSPDHSVLFLDPNTELSKHYAHYLLYATLEYRYSTYQSSDTSTLLGISLEPPPYYLSGAIPGPSPNTFSNNTLPFLYPAPVSRAALYFPQHWSELHSYVAHKLAPHASSSSSHPLPPPLQLGPAIADSWRSHLVELSRARGYAMLYPSFPDTLALVHNDTSRAPAEKRLVGAGGFLSQLPHEDLPAWGEMGFLDMWGKKIDGPEGGVEFEAATLAYRAGISNCPAAKEGAMWEVDDLFCDEAVKSV